MSTGKKVVKKREEYEGLVVGDVYDPDEDRRNRVHGAYSWKRINATVIPAPADLKALRMALKLTIQNCADMVHVNKSSWCRWESTEETIMAPMSHMAWDLFLHKTRAARTELVIQMKILQEELKTM